jgi:hypothetical protein
MSLRHHHSLPIASHHINSQHPSFSRVTTALLATSKTDQETTM